MPYLKLNTNIAINNEQAPQLLTQLSQLVASETGKPENYVMVELAEKKPMLFAGTADPLAFLECKSIGLSGRQTKSLASSLSRLLENQLSIPSA